MSINKLLFDAAREGVIGIIVANEAMLHHVISISALPSIGVQVLPAVIFMR